MNSQKKTINKPEKFCYGNYDRYYGYRNSLLNNNEDTRIKIFKNYSYLFNNCDILDIGCNNGQITIEIAKEFPIKSIIGIDIDGSLIQRANQNLKKNQSFIRKKLNTNNQEINNKSEDSENIDQEKFQTKLDNITFRQGNYVLPNETLLDLDSPKFNTILCLSVTKWIHLNNGDNGLKIAFKRMFRQLKSGGSLILEAQDWQSYKRRKKLTEKIHQHFQQIKFKPNEFDNYLLSNEVGFARKTIVELPKHHCSGFERLIKVFEKS